MGILLFFLAAWIFGAGVVWFFWWMTKPWRFVPRLLLLSLVAAVFIAPGAVFGEGGAAPVPAILVLIAGSSADRLWCLLPVFLFWLVLSGVALMVGWPVRRQDYEHAEAEPARHVSDAHSLLNQAARLESVDRAQAIAKYQEIIALFPETTASGEAKRNIETLRSQI